MFRVSSSFVVLHAVSRERSDPGARFDVAKFDFEARGRGADGRVILVVPCGACGAIVGEISPIRFGALSQPRPPRPASSLRSCASPPHTSDTRPPHAASANVCLIADTGPRAHVRCLSQNRRPPPLKARTSTSSQWAQTALFRALSNSIVVVLRHARPVDHPVVVNWVPARPHPSAMRASLWRSCGTPGARDAPGIALRGHVPTHT